MTIYFNKSIQYRLGISCSLKNTIMGKTADLATVQKTIIDTSTKSKSQSIITERCGCSQSAVSKHIQCKVDWKEEIG